MNYCPSCGGYDEVHAEKIKLGSFMFTCTACDHRWMSSPRQIDNPCELRSVKTRQGVHLMPTPGQP